MQTVIIIITNVFNFEKKNYYCFNNMTYSYKTWRQDNISEACANNSGFLAGMNTLINFLSFNGSSIFYNLSYMLIFTESLDQKKIWTLMGWCQVSSIPVFHLGIFLIDLIFTFSFTFVFVFLLSSFIVLLLFINSITVILKDSFCSLYSIFYTFAM